MIEHTDHRQSRLNYNLAWAKTYLKKVGAIDNSRRGVWSITKEGEKLSESDMVSVPAQVRKQFVEDRQKKATSGNGLMPDEGADTPELGWKDKLLQVLRGLSRMPSRGWHSDFSVKRDS